MSGKTKENGKPEWICNTCFHNDTPNKEGHNNMDNFKMTNGDFNLDEFFALQPANMAGVFPDLNTANQRKILARVFRDTDIIAGDKGVRCMNTVQRKTSFDRFINAGLYEAASYTRDTIARIQAKKNALGTPKPEEHLPAPRQTDIFADVDDVTPVHVPLKPAADDKTAQLRELLGLSQAPEIDYNVVKELIRAELETATRRIIIEKHDTPEIDMGKQHQLFPKVLKLAERRFNIMLVGAAGSGKTTIAKNVAKALDIPFNFTAFCAQTTITNLMGYMDANSNYVESAFYKVYKNGGVFLGDEIDGCNPNVLVSLNAAIDNGICSFPCGLVEKHEDFLFIGCANTYGRGADKIYVGRNALDGATMNRFKFLACDYDNDFELDLALKFNDDAHAVRSWVSLVQRIRNAIFDLKERVVASPRASIDGAKMLADGWSQDEILDMTIFQGIPRDLKEKLLESGSKVTLIQK